MGNAIVNPVGVFAVGDAGTANVWGIINDSQNANWQSINDSQSANWTDVVA
jgi:hypothetical protein